MDNNLHKGHRKRLRQKFADCATSLLEHEILELLLFYPVPQKSTNDIAHFLINKFGNLNNVLSQPIEELTKLDGIGESTALFLKFIYDLCENYDSYKPKKTKILSFEDEKKYFKNYFKNPVEDDCLLLNVNCSLEEESTLSLKIKDFFKDDSEIQRITDFLLKTDCKRIIIGIKIHSQNANVNYPKFVCKFKERFSSMNLEIIDCIILKRNSIFSIKNSGFVSF